MGKILMAMEELRKDLQHIKTEVENFISDIKADVRTILYILTGTEYDSTSGLIQRFENEKLKSLAETEKQNKLIKQLEDRITKLEKWKDRIVWAGLGMALPAGYGISGIIHFFFGKK